MLADLDLTALRVRLAELEGFDATGLLLRDAEGAEEGIVVYDDGRDVLVHGEQDPQWWTKDQDSKPYTKGDEEPHVSAAAAATRDRLARWCAGRLGKSVGSSGPCWGPVANSYEGGGWGLLPRLGHGMCIFMRPDWLPLAALPPLVPGGESVWVGVPALADIDPADPRLLPDGSRLVDALALVAVARHLGGSRGEGAVGDRTPVAVGQIRRDPRRPDRCVRVVEVGVPACAYPDRQAARVEEVTRVIGAWVPYEDGRRTRIRLDRLERWGVVDG